MEAFVYRGVDGELYRSGHVDKHHIFPQSKMSSHNERQWNNHTPGLVLPMVKRFHNDGKDTLHSNVPFPPKPDRDLMYIIRELTWGFDPDMTVYDKYLSINERVHEVAETSRDIGLVANASRIANNLELQTPWILRGMVERIEVPDVNGNS